MNEAVYGVFARVEDAERAIGALKDHGADGNEISVVRRSDGAGLPSVGREASEGFSVTGPADVTAGALKGGAAGLALGVLAGAVALTVPGIGPILAAGPISAAIGAALATTAAGAVGGGVVGYLVDQGVPEEAAGVYQEAVARGDILVTVRSLHLSSEDARMLLDKYGAAVTAAHNIREVTNPVLEPPVVDRTIQMESGLIEPPVLPRATETDTRVPVTPVVTPVEPVRPGVVETPPAGRTATTADLDDEVEDLRRTRSTR